MHPSQNNSVLIGVDEEEVRIGHNGRLIYITTSSLTQSHRGSQSLIALPLYIEEFQILKQDHGCQIQIP